MNPNSHFQRNSSVSVADGFEGVYMRRCLRRSDSKVSLLLYVDIRYTVINFKNMF